MLLGWTGPESELTQTKLVDVDLTKLVPELDTLATDIVAHQKDALLSRKDLAQKTKDFRKLDDAAKLAETKSLLKGSSRAAISTSAHTTLILAS